jgi:hypothetical protein
VWSEVWLREGEKVNGHSDASVDYRDREWGEVIKGSRSRQGVRAGALLSRLLRRKERGALGYVGEVRPVVQRSVWVGKERGGSGGLSGSLVVDVDMDVVYENRCEGGWLAVNVGWTDASNRQ